MASKALDELELLRREVEALKWDMAKAQEQIQRAVWRRKSADAATVDSTDGTAALASKVENTAPYTAPSTVTATDPVSAKLIARRGRRSVHPPDDTTPRVNPQDEE